MCVDRLGGCSKWPSSEAADDANTVPSAYIEDVGETRTKLGKGASWRAGAGPGENGIIFSIRGELDAT
jgi:hypothetical protein